MRPQEGNFVMFYDEQDKIWKQGMILAYTEMYAKAIIELEDGSIVTMPVETQYRILKNGRTTNKQ